MKTIYIEVYVILSSNFSWWSNSWVLFMTIALIGNITMKTDIICALLVCNVTMEIGHCFVWKSSWIFVLLESS